MQPSASGQSRPHRRAWALLGLAIFTASAYSHGESHRDAGVVQPAADSFWSALPALVPGSTKGERGKAILAPRNMTGTELQVFSPGQPEAPTRMMLENGRWLVTPSSPDKGGHHWLMARQTRDQMVITASTAWTFPAKGDAPTRLLRAPRDGLEIVPDHIPEHGGMREGEDWEFHVRHDGHPLAGKVVQFETESGTRSRVVTDARGIARIAFPRDINPADIDPQGGATRTRKGFVLAVEHQQGEIHHLSAFNFFYYPDLMRERSLTKGFGFLALGMLLALPLLRRKETERA